jgi:predicted XRE-type DNA-binding protein
MKRATTTTPDSASAHITPVGGNVFADLGFSPAEAKALQAQMLMDSLANWIAQEKLTQAKAAIVLGVTRPRVSDVIRHKNSNFTVDALIDMVVRTGQSVQIRV